MLQNLVKSQPVFIENLMNFGMVTNQFISHCIRLLELKGIGRTTLEMRNDFLPLRSLLQLFKLSFPCRMQLPTEIHGMVIAVCF